MNAFVQIFDVLFIILKMQQVTKVTVWTKPSELAAAERAQTAQASSRELESKLNETVAVIQSWSPSVKLPKMFNETVEVLHSCLQVAILTTAALSDKLRKRMTKLCSVLNKQTKNLNRKYLAQPHMFARVLAEFADRNKWKREFCEPLVCPISFIR